MNRRRLLTAIALAAPALAAPATAPAAGPATEPWSREAYEQALRSGEPFMLDFYAPW